MKTGKLAGAVSKSARTKGTANDRQQPGDFALFITDFGAHEIVAQRRTTDDDQAESGSSSADGP